MLAAAAAHTGISSGTILATCTVLTLVAGFAVFTGSRLLKVIKRTMRFLDDWNGEPQRDGVKPRPGVMARLGSVEDIVTAVQAELTLNGGSSMHDVVVATAKDVVTVKEDVARLSSRVELFEHQREKRDG